MARTLEATKQHRLRIESSLSSDKQCRRMTPKTRLPSTSRDPHFTAARLRKCCPLRPSLAFVLGSGFQHAVSPMRVKAEIPYDALPGFSSVAVSGHTGKLLLGHLGPTPVLVLSGRAHFYEGHSMEAITFPVRVLAAFGIRDLLLTNAAGGINRRFRPGDFMYLTDHINAMPENPLRGELAPGQTRFVDLSQTYDKALNALLRKAAKKAAAPLHGGVYVAVAGPCYETPAEIRALARLGADAIGMSTVPEAIVARQCGLCVAALSCITNLAAGYSKKPLSHADVLATGKRVKQTTTELLRTFAELYGENR